MEKIIIKNEKYSSLVILIICLLIGLLISGILFAACATTYSNTYESYYDTYQEHDEGDECYAGYYGYSYYGYSYNDTCWECEFIEDNPSQTAYVLSEALHLRYLIIYTLPIIGWLIVGGFVYLYLRSYELVVTDKRIIAKVFFGFRTVVLPLDFVTAASRVWLFKILCISSPSGKIRMSLIKNAKAMYEAINDLLIQRQTPTIAAPVSETATQL